MDTETQSGSGTDRWGGGRRGESMRRAMGVAVSNRNGSGVQELASPKLRSLICPFCGGLTADSGRCDGCHARFDPLSRQATQNEMGPWFVRDDSMPHRPGCNYSTIQRLVVSGGVQPNSVVRGPSSHQFWMLAKHTPGVAQLLGVCHNCGAGVERDAFACGRCQEPFSTDRDRQHLGLGPSRPLPGRAQVELLAVRAEPPAGAELVTGPAVYPMSGGAGDGDVERRGASGGDRRAGSGSGSGGGADELEVIKQVDELGRAVRALRRAWIAERKRAWISVACAGAVTVLGVMLIVLT